MERVGCCWYVCDVAVWCVLVVVVVLVGVWCVIMLCSLVLFECCVVVGVAVYW